MDMDMSIGTDTTTDTATAADALASLKKGQKIIVKAIGTSGKMTAQQIVTETKHQVRTSAQTTAETLNGIFKQVDTSIEGKTGKAFQKTVHKENTELRDLVR